MVLEAVPRIFADLSSQLSPLGLWRTDRNLFVPQTHTVAALKGFKTPVRVFHNSFLAKANMSFVFGPSVETDGN
jgi:hypothetical protein